MDHFHYIGDELHGEGVPISRIADAVGTPFYCYSEATLLHHLETFRQAFATVPHIICFSVKANSNLAVLDALVRHGAGLDIVSGGELTRAQRIGCPGSRMVFSGVGKSSAEIRAALEHGILMFNAESAEELHRLNAVAGAMGRKAPIALRINPDVDPHTHHHISTGHGHSKFGIAYEQAQPLYRLAARLPHLEVVGLDCHIGSQLTSVAPFVEALRRVLVLLRALHHDGLNIRYLDLGGGLGIPYNEDGEPPPHPHLYAKAILDELNGLDLTLVLEPGRVIAGNAGILVARVEYIKDGEGKRFIITDAGMNDLIRPAFYDAYHRILPVIRSFDRDERVVDVVGPICESADYFAKDRLLTEFREGELLAIRSAGAYGFVMSSNYNSRPRAAEVMVRGDRFAVVRRRETMDQVLENETLFPE